MYLTATYCGLFINVKNNLVMTDNEKSQMIAEAENIEAIRDFFTQWWTVEQLYETSAKVCSTMLHLLSRGEGDAKEFKELMEQHLMLIDLVKPFARKEDEV